MHEMLCNLISAIVLILIVLVVYRYWTTGALPWKSGMKDGFMDKMTSGCGSCPYLARNLDVTKV